MLNWFKKLFIKDYANTCDHAVRLSYGVTAGVFGIISNAILFALKMAIGIIASSVTVIADAINNLSDAGTSAITAFGFKMSSRPADPEHPFGHARYEQITALIIAIAVMFIGIALAKESISKIFNPSFVSVSALTYIVLAFAILLKIFQMAVYNNFSKAVDSGVLKAAAADSRNDILSTAAALFAMAVISLFPNIGFSVDGVAGLLVSIFIVISSIKLIKDTITPLLGAKPDKELIKKIKQKIHSYPGVLGTHDLMIHSYGAANVFAVVHVEVSSSEDVMVSHDLMDEIEREFKEQLGINLIVHMDPIETDNPQVNKLKAEVEKAIATLDPRLKLHDFRIVPGKTHTNILFDVDVPYGARIGVPELEAACRSRVKLGNRSFYIINVDIDYDV